ncbi:MAG: amino acid adenylation domain-containing protein [bacterium]|nr:amino acid adenylation domain-containing protein [bacterium]
MENKELFELTNPQKNIWNLEQFYSGSSLNTIVGTAFINETVNIDILKKSIFNVIQKNDSFKLKFLMDDGSIKQYLSKDLNFPIYMVDVSSISELKDKRAKILEKPFNLLNSFLFEFYIFKFPNNHAAFMLKIHHLISDAWTLGFVSNAIIKNYSAIKNNSIVETENVPSYIDYINSETEYLNSKKFDKDKIYWEELFSNRTSIASIPSVKKPSIITSDANRLTFEISNKTMEKISFLCNNLKISKFNFFMAIISIYIGKLNNLNDFVIGTPILNRVNHSEKNCTGMFISTLPFKFNLNTSLGFDKYVQEIAISSLNMLRHQKYPYQYLLEHLRKQDADLPNLFNILVSYQLTNAKNNNEDINYTTEWTFNKNCSNNLEIHMYDINDTGSLDISYDYQTSLYNMSDIKNLHNRILNIIDQVLKNNSILIENIDILTFDEKDFLINKLNMTDCNYDSSKTIVNMFEESVELNPNKTALISNNFHYTYKELNEYANILAHSLSNNYSVKPNDIVGIMLHRSPEMIIGLLAIIKCGATYLPIDPDYPDERIKYMLENSGAKTILTDDLTGTSIPVKNTKVNIKLTSKIYKDKSSDDKSNLYIKQPSNSLLYLIYTSGSTGKPKGVMITHKNVNNFINGMKNIIDFSSNKVMVSLTTICFDIFGLELWCSLTSGLTFVLANEKEQNDAKLLNDLCLKNNVNMMQTTPSRYLSLLSDTDNLDFLKNITDIMVGGEALTKNLLDIFKKYSNAKIYNMYGPTETTIWSTVKDLSDSDQITIGKPIANTQCYILDNNLNLLPPYTPGNLYIGGDGVSSGYLNRPELTKAKFISSPFKENRLIYNTNDLAYITDNGEIVHLGRTDFQVKLRGYRIELGEIENKIMKYPNINNVVVIADSTNKYLLCYYVATEDINISKLSSYLLKYLPNYMIPAYFKRLDKIPLTPNGKVDRKSLPVIDTSINIESPSTDTEKLIASALSTILKREDLDINTPFLSLGLDSLGLIQLQTLLLTYKLNLTTQDFYRYPSIKTLAKRIDSHLEYYTELESNIPEEFKHTESELKDINLSTDSNVLGNVLLTGTNGFIGIHVLHELLFNSNSKIHCFVRGTSLNHSIQRLDDSFNFYFGLSIKPYLGNRIEVYNGHITEDNFKLSQKALNFLVQDVDTIIHTAAIVKHYGDFEQFKKTNIDGAKNIVEFAFKNKKRLIHISSISVSGNYLVKQNNKNVKFSENDLYIGQHYTNNVYVNSKFDAEKIVYSYMQKGLIAEVLRIGILSGRYSDGFFQKNISENAFYGRIKSLVDLHCVSEKMLDQKIEFTPVDLCAKAIVLLSSSKIAENKVYHLYNDNFYTIREVIDTLKNFDINISIISEKNFEDTILKISKDKSSSNSLKAIINDISLDNSDLALDYGFTVNILSDYTKNYLKAFNFKWPENSSVYLNKIIAYMKYVKFL